MDITIEISGDRVSCLQDRVEALSAPLGDFLEGLARQWDYAGLQEPIPDGVRFIRSRGDGVVLVLEEKPKVRTVQWLTDSSPADFGKGAVYRPARLAFPFLVIGIAFRSGSLTGVQECWYRTQPLETLEDELLLPNLYNVSVDSYDQQCWLCLANLKADLTRMTWNQKVAAIRSHLWGGGWNRSSEVHEGKSYWSVMQSVDPRVGSVPAWEQASRADPLFPLQVCWKASGKNVGQAVEAMLNRVAAPPLGASASSLVQAIRPSRTSAKKSSPKKTLFGMLGV